MVYCAIHYDQDGPKYIWVIPVGIDNASTFVLDTSYCGF